MRRVHFENASSTVQFFYISAFVYTVATPLSPFELPTMAAHLRVRHQQITGRRGKRKCGHVTGEGEEQEL